MEISKPLMSPNYLNGINDDRRPESPRSPTKTIIPITPGLAPPTPYGNAYTHTPSPEPPPMIQTPANTFPSASTTSTTSTGSYAPTTSYASTPSYTPSPITPRRVERKEDPVVEESTTPRKRSNSAETPVEKDPPARVEPRTREGRKDGLSNPMKSFRVNLDDPCWKVLPAAMKKYDVKGREEDYRLYITYGDTGTQPFPPFRVIGHKLTCRA
jgi:hypothetical protein